jgi:hypothetical protein
VLDRAILGQTGHIADPELGSHIGYGVRRHVDRLGQKGAEETNGRQLDGEAELIMVTTPLLVEPLEVGTSRWK